MTEEDTFNALKKREFEYVHELWLQTYHHLSPIDASRVFQPHGWTYEEFAYEHKRRILSDLRGHYNS